MAKFRFEKEYDDDFAKFESSLTCEATGLDELLEYFKMFLQGCGYSIDGELMIEKPPQDDGLD